MPITEGANIKLNQNLEKKTKLLGSHYRVQDHAANPDHPVLTIRYRARFLDEMQSSSRIFLTFDIAVDILR